MACTQSQRRERVRKRGRLFGRKGRDRGEGGRTFPWVEEEEGRPKGLEACE